MPFRPLNLRRPSFVATQIASFVGVSVATLAVASFLVLNRMESTVRALAERSLETILGKTAAQIEADVEHVVRDLALLASLQSLREYVQAPLFSKRGWEEQVAAELQNVLAARESLALLQFEPEDGGAPLRAARPTLEGAVVRLDPAAVPVTDQVVVLPRAAARIVLPGGAARTGQHVVLVAPVTVPRVMEPGWTRGGRLVAVIPGSRFAATLQTLDLAGPEAPLEERTTALLLDAEATPLAAAGPLAARIAPLAKDILAGPFAAQPRRDLEGGATAFWFTLPERGWRILAVVPEAFVLRDVRATRRVVLGVFALGVICAVLLTIPAGKAISRPIARLAQATEAVSAGHLDRPIRLDSYREFATLGQNFNVMLARLQQTIAERIRESEVKASLEQELETAALFQQLFLPPEKLATDGFDLVARYRPASHMGGDWYAYARTKDGKLHVHLGDVTGHGTGSAMVASFCKGVTDALYAAGSRAARDVPLLETHEVLNRLLYNDGRSIALMTLLSIAVDVETGELTYLSSGHPPQFVTGPGGGQSSLLVAQKEGTLLGFKPETAPEIRPKTVLLEEGQTVFLYSDGLVDVARTADKRFNVRRLGAFLATHAASSPEELARAIEGGLLAGGEPVDDVTYVAIRFARFAGRVRLDRAG